MYKLSLHSEWCDQKSALPAKTVSDVVRVGQCHNDWLSFVALRLKHCVSPIALNGCSGPEGQLQLFQSTAQLAIAFEVALGGRRSGS